MVGASEAVGAGKGVGNPVPTFTVGAWEIDGGDVGLDDVVGASVGTVIVVSIVGDGIVGEYVGISVVGAFVKGVGMYVGHLVGTTGAEVCSSSTS